MPEHSFESLQARLNRLTDTSDFGDELPLTRLALHKQDAVDRLVSLVDALETERVLVPAMIETDGIEQKAVETIETDLGPALVAFSSVQAMQEWDAGARPVPIQGRRAAMLAVLHSQGRMVINVGSSSVRIPRPAVVALAHGDSWLPAWEDHELIEQLSSFTSSEIAFVKPLPSAGATLRVSVGVLQQARTEKVREGLQKIASSPRLRPAAEAVEIVPTLVAKA